MLRSLLIYLSKAGWARGLVTNWGFAWRAASRFIAGESLSEAIEAVSSLNARGINATLDHLGEHTTSQETALKAKDEILTIVQKISEDGVRANVSVKLTQIGLAVDEGLCARNLAEILDVAKANSNFVRIDMEDSPWVDRTLAVYQSMRDGFQFDNVGIVIQSYLYRSESDIQNLMSSSARIRLCKGAYDEPAEVAYPEKERVDKNFDHLTKLLVDGALNNGSPRIGDDGRIPPIPAIASHDPERLVFAKNYAGSAGLPDNAIEFQMLYGIRRDLQEQLVAEGYPVRVYVPYGTEWYPYYVRRLAERPANLWFFISNFFRG